MPSNRTLAATGILAIALSTMFPVAASVIPIEQFPAWFGPLDVGLAFIVVGFAIWIEARAGRSEAVAHDRASRVYRAFAIVPFALLVVFFVSGDVVRWDVLLAGLAWRSGVLLYATPAVCALLGGAE
jgi:hypothetical protein